MKYAAHDPYGRRIVGRLYRSYTDGITIEYDNGVREFVSKSRVIGPIAETEAAPVVNDLFAEIQP